MGKHVFARHFQFAETDEQRLEDLQNALDDPECSAIICSRGGYGTVRIIARLDFTKFNPGENRNLDWRREFHRYLDHAPIKATSIFNGAFADMLTGQMPLILFKQKIILFWGKVVVEIVFICITIRNIYFLSIVVSPII